MSLIHDDLPAMASDDLRRGPPHTQSQVFGANAITCRDALLNPAAFEDGAATPARRCRPSVAEGGLVALSAALLLDWSGGQVVDLESEGAAGGSLGTLEYIHAA